MGKSKDEHCSAGSFAWARHNDVTVNAMLRANACHTEIIGVMAAEKAKLIARIVKLEQIAPKKVTRPDGVVMVWHCPDHMVPSIDLPNVEVRDGGGGALFREWRCPPFSNPTDSAPF